MQTTDVDIFFADTRDHDCEVMAGKLGRDCMERLVRINHPRRRAQFILGRLLLRHALRQMYGAIEENWVLATSSGKPHLVGANMPEISLSHSRELVACAVAPVAVGLDVEYCREREFAALAEQICAPDELHRFLSFPMIKRSEAFYRMWTLKEAIFKLHGRDIALPGRPPQFEQRTSALKYKHFPLRVDFLAALAVWSDYPLRLRLHPPSFVKAGG